MQQQQQLKTVDYYITYAYSLDDLQGQVRELLNTGWQPIGSVLVYREYSTALHREENIFCQTLVRYAEQLDLPQVGKVSSLQTQVGGVQQGQGQGKKGGK